MQFKEMSHFKQRLIVGSCTTTLVLLALYYSTHPLFSPFFVLLTAGLIASALMEYYAITRRKGYQPLVKIGVVATFAYIVAIFLSTKFPFLTILAPSVLLVALAATFGYYCKKGKEPLVNGAITLFGLAYLTVPLACLIAILYFPFTDSTQDGRLWLLYLLVVTKLTDTGAYFSGKLFGKHKMAPFISPKKTWEGAIGGAIAALLASLLFHSAMSLSLLQSVFIGVTVSLLAQFGDLAESLLKRDGGVKDSSHIPGLGGMLDVVDSLVFTSPFIYFLMLELL